MSIAEKLTVVAQNQQKVYDAGVAAGQATGGGYDEGYQQGKTDAVEDLPAGYIKVDPTWTDFSNLCYARPSMAKSLKYSDTANGKSFQTMFSTITTPYATEDVVIPRLDYRKGTNFTNMFIYSRRVVEIGEMDISNATAVSNMFNGCSGLKKITFVPGCIKISISFANSNLLEDTAIASIIDGLADLTGQTQQTLTLHNAVGSKLTDAQKATITARNWALVY